MVDILQTLGICIGSIALVFIALFLFLITTRLEMLFDPFSIFQDEEFDAIEAEEIEDEKPAKKTGRRYGKEKK